MGPLKNLSKLNLTRVDTVSTLEGLALFNTSNRKRNPLSYDNKVEELLSKLQNSYVDYMGKVIEVVVSLTTPTNDFAYSLSLGLLRSHYSVVLVSEDSGQDLESLKDTFKGNDIILLVNDPDTPFSVAKTQSELVRVQLSTSVPTEEKLPPIILIIPEEEKHIEATIPDEKNVHIRNNLNGLQRMSFGFGVILLGIGFLFNNYIFPLALVRLIPFIRIRIIDLIYIIPYLSILSYLSIITGFAFLLAYFFFVRKLMTSMTRFIAGSSAIVLYLILYLPSISFFQLNSDSIRIIVFPIYYPGIALETVGSLITLLLLVIGIYYLANFNLYPRISIIYRSFVALKVIALLLLHYLVFSIENFPISISNALVLFFILVNLSVIVIIVAIFFIGISSLKHNGNAFDLEAGKQTVS